MKQNKLKNKKNIFEGIIWGSDSSVDIIDKGDDDSSCWYSNETRKKLRDKNVNGTLNFLKKNKINFNASNTPNIVVINKKTYNIFLSLKKEGNLLKCRYSGSKKWYKFSKSKFLEIILNKKL